MHRSEVIDIQESEKFYVVVYEGLGHPKPLNPHLIFGGLVPGVEVHNVSRKLPGWKSSGVL